MTEEIEQLLRNLHLKQIAAIIDDELVHAEKHQLSYGAFLARLLRAQYHHRQETALAWRIKQARFPEVWTLESFPFKRQPGVNPKQIRALPLKHSTLLFRSIGLCHFRHSTKGRVRCCWSSIPECTGGTRRCRSLVRHWMGTAHGS